MKNRGILRESTILVQMMRRVCRFKTCAKRAFYQMAIFIRGGRD